MFDFVVATVRGRYKMDHTSGPSASSGPYPIPTRRSLDTLAACAEHGVAVEILEPAADGSWLALV
jgi:hypothetical protein